LGKNQTTPFVIERIKSKLPQEEFEALKSATTHMPAWMAHAIRAAESPRPRA
jgi:hypothetical protein